MERTAGCHMHLKSTYDTACCGRAGAKPFFTFGTEPPACQLQCWSLEPYLKQWLLQEQSFHHMASPDGAGAFLGSLVSTLDPKPQPPYP